MIFFNNLTVQDKVRDNFIHSIESKRLAHAYLFYGAEGNGKTAFAFELAKAVNCISDQEIPCNNCPSCQKINSFNHPDIKYVFPISSQEKSDRIRELYKLKAKNPYAALPVSGHLNIAIDDIRTLKNEAKYAPYEAKKRVFIINGTEYFSREAANSFLKLLEEPPENLMLVLTCNDLFSLLDTIRSRCQLIHFNQFNDNQAMEIINKYREVDEDITSTIRIAQNNMQRVFELLDEDTSGKRDAVYSFLKAIAASNFFNVSTIIDGFVQKRDKKEIKEILELITLWFRDSIHYLYTSDMDDFVNLDYKDQISKFAMAYQNSAFDTIIELLDNAGRHIDNNAHPVLTLTNLAININENLIRTKELNKEG